MRDENEAGLSRRLKTFWILTRVGACQLNG